MRGSDTAGGSLFSYVDLEKRVRADHPLRVIRGIVNIALADLSAAFDSLYAPSGRESIPPERLLRALLLQAFYSIRSERQLVERIEAERSCARPSRTSSRPPMLSSQLKLLRSTTMAMRCRTSSPR